MNETHVVGKLKFERMTDALSGGEVYYAIYKQHDSIVSEMLGSVRQLKSGRWAGYWQGKFSNIVETNADVMNVFRRLAEVHEASLNYVSADTLAFRKLVSRVHKSMCATNHTDGCGWYYENKKSNTELDIENDPNLTINEVWEHGTHRTWSNAVKYILTTMSSEQLLKMCDSTDRNECVWRLHEGMASVAWERLQKGESK